MKKVIGEYYKDGKFVYYIVQLDNGKVITVKKLKK